MTKERSHKLRMHLRVPTADITVHEVLCGSPVTWTYVTQEVPAVTCKTCLRLLAKRTTPEPCGARFPRDNAGPNGWTISFPFLNCLGNLFAAVQRFGPVDADITFAMGRQQPTDAALAKATVRPCPHPLESRAETSSGKAWCAECGGFLGNAARKVMK